MAAYAAGGSACNAAEAAVAAAIVGSCPPAHPTAPQAASGIKPSETKWERYFNEGSRRERTSVAKKPTASRPQAPQAKWTGMTSSGSSICSLQCHDSAVTASVTKDITKGMGRLAPAPQEGSTTSRASRRAACAWGAQALTTFAGCARLAASRLGSTCRDTLVLLQGQHGAGNPKACGQQGRT